MPSRACSDNKPIRQTPPNNVCVQASSKPRSCRSAQVLKAFEHHPQRMHSIAGWN
jgi:hypothetical protein